nr:laccase-14-like [Quercus suber]
MGIKNIGLVIALFLGFLFLDGLFLCMADHHEITFDLEMKPFNKLCNGTINKLVVDDFPGPQINVRRGDTASIIVRNNEDYNVTIHWHGLSQRKNPWSDGPEYITQCPIQPKSEFTYEIKFEDEEGTLWWHAHSDWVRATVHGAIVVKPAEGTTYPFDEPADDFVIILGEWYNRDMNSTVIDTLEIGGDPDISDSYTINGFPGPQDNCPSESAYSIIVIHGKTYLLRIVNAAMNEEMFFGIQDHNITVVGQDGAYIKPIDTRYILITPGQTMDVLLTADRPFGSYYMVASPFSDSMASYDPNVTSGVVHYGVESAVSPSPSPSPATDNFPVYPSFLPRVKAREAADDFTKRIRFRKTPQLPMDVPQEIDERIFITVSVNELPCEKNNSFGAGADGNSRHYAGLNNISLLTPTRDILDAYYDNFIANAPSPAPLPFGTDFPAFPPTTFDYTGANLPDSTMLGTKVLMIEYGKNVEIVFQGTNIGNPENHPMHLHGYSFYLVGTGCGNFYTDDANYHHDYNLVDPPKVNTIGVPKGGWAAIRFKADNPGVWFMHCHLERHASWGMAGVLIVKNGEQEDEKMNGPPSGGMPKC